MSDDDKKGAGEPAGAGLEKGLTSYGDRGFSLFLRTAFIKGAGYTSPTPAARTTRATATRRSWWRR
jgi:hypothetical protein